MSVWIKHNYNNPDVTNYYIGIIANGYKLKNEDVKFFEKWDEVVLTKKDIVVVSYHRDAFRLALKGIPYVYWVQGIVPEETYEVRKDRARYVLLEIMEYYGLKKAKFVLFVSNYMKYHYEKKYKLSFPQFYIMPCHNDTIKKESFFAEKKYEKNVFCYAGGIARWQCLEETLQIYKKIEESVENTHLLLLVRDKKIALDLAEKYNIKNYTIDFVTVDKLPQLLKNVKYGFIIRKDLELNRVATPTKLLTYMGNGIIPILSECLDGLFECVNDSKYIIRINNDYDVSPILRFMEREVDCKDVYNDYFQIYQNKFNSEKHSMELSKILPN